MIKYNGQDIADIKYNGASIKRVMKDGVQIWPVESELPNTPTGIQLSEYEIVENIEWDYTKMYIGDGENTNLVTLYFTGQDADITSVPAITDWVLNPFNVVNTVTVYTDRVELLMNTAFDSSSSVTISYTPGVNPLKDIDGVLLVELNDQALENLLELQIPTGITLREVIEPSYTYLLDDYPGAVVAYSLQKLSSTVVQGIMVRRDSDNQLIDVQLYDDPNKSIDLDSIIAGGGAGTLGDWVGSANAFVHTWYDQSGSNNNAIASSSIFQPQLIDNGLMLTLNGKSAINFDSTTMLATTYNPALTEASYFSASLHEYNTSNMGLWQKYNGGGGGLDIVNFGSNSQNPRVIIRNAAGTTVAFIATFSITSQELITSIFNSSEVKTAVNNSTFETTPSTVGSIASGNSYFAIGGYLASGINETPSFIGSCQEIIFYDSDQTINKNAIETDINSRYGMYVLTADVDAQLIQADNDNVSDTVIEINGIRSSASDTAVANLISRNVTIITA